MNLRRMSAKRSARLAAGGLLRTGSTFARATKAMVRRRSDTGPTDETRQVVAARSGGRCEWPGCHNEAVDIHHRRARGMGRVSGERAELLNRASNLLHTCRSHHRVVTSAHGELLVRVKEMGWVLEQSQNPAGVWVMTRHDGLKVLLDDVGGWQWQRREEVDAW